MAARIVILGGGLAGYYVARHLERLLRRDEAQITLVDMRSAVTYQPFLAEVVSGNIEPRHILTPLARHLAYTRVLQARVDAIGAAARTVTLEAGGLTWDLPFDQLVVTLGAVTKTFPTPGVAECGIGLKSVEEAAHIRDRVVSGFLAAAAMPKGSPERARLLTHVVVGGGFSGTEGFAEMLDLVRVLLKHHPEVDPSEPQLHLVEATDRILPELPLKDSQWVVRKLEERGGHVRLNTTVSDATGGVIRTSDGMELPAQTLVWATGVSAAPVLRESDLPLDGRGRLRCGADLRVTGDEGPLPGVWGCGDATSVPDLTGDGLPDGSCAPTAQHAVRQAKVLAANVAATLRGEGLAEYRHANAGMVAGLGWGCGIFASGRKRLIIRGPVAWLMHRGYHGLALPSWERKMRVFGDWCAGLVMKRDLTCTAGTESPRRFFEENAVR